jgi:acyl-CoA synthetase (AMP-forming)/AMP-acid ligase II
MVPINPRNLANREEVKHMVNMAMSTTPGRRPVVIVNDDNIAKSIDELALFDNGIKVVNSDSGTSHDWLEFESLMSHSPLHTRQDTDESADKIVDGLILFTSGSTAMPKGCYKQYPMMASMFEGILQSPAQDTLGPGSSFACVLPNNHAFGDLMPSEAHTAGATVVYPGPSFQVSTELHATLCSIYYRVFF